MKTKILILLLAMTALFVVGCEDDDNGVVVIDEVPEPPQGVYSVTGDEQVFIYWYSPYIDDIDGYTIWRSSDSLTGYTQIGYYDAAPNDNLDLIEYVYTDNTVINGETYYYAVASVDLAGQESALSAETVGDTPRPEGMIVLFQYDFYAPESGLILDPTGVTATSFDHPSADIYIDTFLNAFNINATDTGVYLQDMGYAESFDEISYAPNSLDGWSYYGFAELIYGHIYVIWDNDGYFAKLRVTGFGPNSVNFEWAFQTDPNNPELIQPKFDDPKPNINLQYNQKRSSSNFSE